MQIDAYDVLEVDISCNQEDLKKAFKRLSLREHPDKAACNGRNPEEQNQRFIEIKASHEILSDEERRKRYDTFGTDLGKDPPEMEVWNIGLTTLLQPMGAFTVKTLLCRLALWFLAFRYVAYCLILCSIIAMVMYALDSNIPGLGMSTRSPEGLSILVNVGIIDIVVILGWVWPLLAETIGMLYLGSEVCGITVDNLKVGAIGLFISMFVSWLIRGWWWWILGLEVLLMVILLIGVTIAAGIIRLWIDTVQAMRADKVKEWRLNIRKERKILQDEVNSLKRKLHS